MKCLLYLCSALLLLVFPAICATFHVAPGGIDANPGTSANPFATLARARDEVRQFRQAGPLREPVTIWVRGGIYSLPTGVKFEAQDGGTATAPVTYRAWQNEKPILVCGQGFKGVYFRQLIFDGRRQRLARYLNFDPENPYGGGWAYADGKLIPMYQDVPGEDKVSFHYKEQDSRTWARPTELEVFVFARYNWWNDKDDYHLQPNSPAFKLGFQPIPVEKIGPYRDELRATWPIVEAEGAREKPLTSERK